METGRDPAAFGVGNSFAKLHPAVTLRGANRVWQAGKVLFERHWLAGGLEGRLATLGLHGGATPLGIRARI